jgi:DnaJ-class molecular chaperone
MRIDDDDFCPDCQGNGTITRESGSCVDLEPTQTEETCETCGGSGDRDDARRRVFSDEGA